MARPKSSKPKLYRRGSQGNYCFRRFVNGKDREINTGCADIRQAEAFRKNYVEAEITAGTELRHGACASRAADTVIQTITGREWTRLTFEEGYRIYREHTPDYSDLSPDYRTHFENIFRHFGKWCRETNLRYMDEVTQSEALRYSKMIWERGSSEATHDSYIKALSKIFSTVDVITNLPNRNPFHGKIVKRRRQGLVSDGTHQPFEPDMLNAVMKEAATAGQDWFDFFLVGLHTGMRAKDAALFQWSWIHGDVIEFMPYKTRRYRIVARVPINPELQQMLTRRRTTQTGSPFVNPVIAAYRQSSDWITKNSQIIIDKALGVEKTKVFVNEHRKRRSCILSFHSFRTTLMSLLAERQIPYRDAMEIFGWHSMEMVQVYEKMLERAKGERDIRNRNAFASLYELSKASDNVTVAFPLKPSKESLERLIPIYSNVAIGKIFGISDVAIKKWLDKFGLKREKRIESPDLSEEEIQKIRAELQAA